MHISGTERGGAVDTAFCSKSVREQSPASSNLAVSAKQTEIVPKGMVSVCFFSEARFEKTGLAQAELRPFGERCKFIVYTVRPFLTDRC